MIPQNNENTNIEKYGYIDKDPIEEGNFFSNFIIYWAYKIIHLSKLTNIKSEYLGKLSYKRSSQKYLRDIYYIWENLNYKNSCYCPLLWTSIRTNIKSILIITICTILYTILNVISLYYFRIFIKIFSKNISNEEWKNENNLMIPFYYVIIRFCNYILQRKNTQLLNNVGYKSRVELNNLIYYKLLKLSTSIDVKAGDIYNYIQNDSHKIYKLMSNFHNLISVPLLIVMYNYLLFKFMGISFVIGFIVMIIFLIVNYYYRKQFSKYLSLYLKQLDKRMRVTSETFNNLKAIKLYGWDDIFFKKINKEREDELQALNIRYYITTISQTLTWLAPIAMSVCSFGLYQYINKTFKAEDIFTCLAIFISIQSPMRNLPTSFDIILETIACMKRIEYFLKLPEIQDNKIIKNDSGKKEIAIQIINGKFKWGIIQTSSIDDTKQKKKVENSNKMTNKYIKISGIANDNSLIMNKKDSNSLLDKDNENKKLSSEFINYKKSPKNNNLLQFQSSNDESNTIINNEFYLNNINLTIKKGEFVCIIGEVGSGKSSLIHAILNNMIVDKESKIIINGKISYVSQESWIQNNTIKKNILFFQPFDKEKYEKILNICELYQDLNTFNGGDLTEIGEKGITLSGGQKARVCLARAIYNDGDIYILDDPISALDADIGKKIMDNCILDYLKGKRKTIILITHALQYISHADKIYYMKKGKIEFEGTFNELLQQNFYSELNFNINQGKKENLQNDKLKEGNSSIYKKILKDDKKINRITKDEAKETGKIDKKVYMTYFSYIGGIKFILILLIILILWQGLKIFSDLWLGFWSEHQGEKSNTFFFAIYGITATSSSIFNYIRTRIITSGSLKCSKRLHCEMIKSLINAPINLFHDIVPKGQIYNKLSKDLPTVDTYSMFWFMMSTAYGSSFLGAILICSFFQKFCLIFLPIFMVICWHLYRFYINCSRELHRIEGVLNSPVLNLVNETIPGISTIRSYNLQNKYIEIFQKRVDEHYKIFYYINGTDQWYLLYLNCLSLLFLIYMVIMVIINRDSFTPKIIGIMLTYSLILQEDIIEFLTYFSYFENTMTKAERSLSYTKIISERPHYLDSDIKLNKWPSKGEIEFKNIFVKYRNDTELVLKDINFHLNSGEHLGIVGRTGSGKSTIALCIFRILESSSGKIYIDGEDISSIGLKKLRENITIIPQDSTLISGTLRYNIDPINAYKDEEIIKVIEKIGFDYLIKRNNEGLDQKISENGNNLSLGEKQLICIARGILRKTKIFVLDEATASIDIKTEDIIQKALDEILKDSTMIIIAHRIRTVMKANKILVLDNGKVVEFGTPENLTKNKNSYFYKFYSNLKIK